MTRKTIAIGSNTSHYVWQARKNLIKTIQNDGHDVVVVAPTDAYTKRFAEMGVAYAELPMRMNKNPISDFLIYRRFLKTFRAVQPDIYLGFTIKPNIYGSLAAHRLRIPTINNIAGLGALFGSAGLVARLAKALYRIALRRAALIFFQNPDDLRLFTTSGVVRHKHYDLLPGSGVDLTKFAYAPLPVDTQTKPLRFLLIGRMLWDKGVGEFVQAARNIRQTHGNVQFCLLGGLDNDNPGAISRAQMDEWVRDGDITYLGYSDNVKQEIVNADCIVLPSAYPEGTPRTLLEASAVGRPIIATDAPGCRETIDDGVNGYLCKLRDAADLQVKLEKIIGLSPQARRAMGHAGRVKMEHEFDEAIVIGKYIDKIRIL
ncbi:glycosyltransferase involved in cell wall biosynthesis [Yoonia maricola]|uniref:Glycosyltransferase involved in cell wall biosynthesis n=1 Tax=Yoonia maricola TaxID=420999 RepID=A0A2M8W0D3_9RHOB|nr:glycosyltransferase family 4 protein [Yoonia maricola]PJI84384.1 glycosyltransferase involved in cell wall biosynthesis [Yoonia maricola]